MSFSLWPTPDARPLPVEPPIAPMLGRLVRELPTGDYAYEPKWDGFRCVAFRNGESVDLRSRNDRPLARYFPELVAALSAIASSRFVLDGEILVPSGDGYDFSALMLRLHPALSRVRTLSAAAPAVMIAFDLLAVDDRDLRELPFCERRSLLENVIDTTERVRVTPATNDIDTAAAWLHEGGGGIDGVMAKDRQLPYESGRRAMRKVKLEQTLDCVVAGVRLLKRDPGQRRPRDLAQQGDRPSPSALLLGLYDESGALQHIGVASGFSERLRHELLEQLRPLVVPLRGHPWEHGFLLEGSPVGRLKGAAGRWSPDEMELDWIPIAPTRVLEVSYDHVDARRLRHPARFRRWRLDRDAHTCTFQQM